MADRLVPKCYGRRCYSLLLGAVYYRLDHPFDTSAISWLMDSFCCSLSLWLSSRRRCSCDTSSCHWLRSSTSRHCRSTTCRCSCDSSRAIFSSCQSTQVSKHLFL